VIGFLEGLEGFALRLILELYRASGLPVGRGISLQHSTMLGGVGGGRMLVFIGGV